MFPKKKFGLHSLRNKLFASYLIVLILMTVFFSMTFLSVVEKYFLDGLSDQYLNEANFISHNLASTTIMQDYDPSDAKAIQWINEALEEKSKESGYRILVYDKNAMNIGDSSSVQNNRYLVNPEIIKALNGEDNKTIYSDNESMYVCTTVYDNNSDIIGAVLIVADISGVYEIMEEIDNQIYILLLVMLAFIIMIVIVMSGWFVVPIKRMLDVIEDFSSGRFSRRMDSISEDEYGDLARAFNDMAEKIEQSEKTRDEFVSNVSHELKTPLTAIKVLSDSIINMDNVPTEIYQEFLEDINGEVDRMTSIVNDLLTLVKLDKDGIELNISIVDAGELIKGIIKRLQPIAQNKNIELKSKIAKNITMELDTVKISLAISNIIENAIKYTDEKGLVEVELIKDSQFAYITVIDNGEGMAEEELSKIFTRFYRVDKARDRETGGTGLGLSIANSTVLLHNGFIKVSSKLNEGTTFVLRIPLQYLKKEESNEQ